MTIQSNRCVFLTDGVMRRTLAAIRALGRNSITTTCGEETALNPTFFSRYCNNRFRYPSPRKHPQALVTSLLSYLEQNPHECLLPMEQDTLDIILVNCREFEQLTHLPFADNETYQIFRDKGKTIKLAKRAGIPHPRTIFPSSLEQVIKEAKSLQFPVVIKPRFNWAGRGIRYVQSLAQLPSAYRHIHELYPFSLIQERIPQGEKYNVNCLFDEHSRPVAVCAQREVRNYPLRHGISTVQESVWRPDLIDLTVQLLQANNWYGVANVDYMIDPRDDTPMLMEVNPRFWATLQLSIHCGINFPLLLYRLARGETIDPVRAYRVGVINRSFLPYDILHFLSNPHRWQMQPSFFDFFGSAVHFDILSADDLMPIMGFFLTCIRYMLDPEIWIRMAHMERVGKLISKLSGKQITGFDHL